MAIPQRAEGADFGIDIRRALLHGLSFLGVLPMGRIESGLLNSACSVKDDRRLVLSYACDQVAVCRGVSPKPDVQWNLTFSMSPSPGRLVWS